MSTRTFTAPKAYIEIENVKAGIIKDLSFNEDIGRATVKGLGDLWDIEVPAISGSGRFTIGEFFIDFSQEGMKKMINRYGGAGKILDTLSLGELPFTISIFQKMGVMDETQRIISTVEKYGKVIAKLEGCYLDSQSFQLSNDGVAGLNSSGRYLNPVGFGQV